MYFYSILTIFFLAHIYLFWKLTQLFGRGFWQIPVCIFFVAMLGVWWVRNRTDTELFFSLYLAFGFVWLGFIIISTAFLLARDFLWFAVKICRVREDYFFSCWARSKRSIAFALGLSVLVSCYAVYEAHDIQPYHITLPTEKLPEGVKRFRIAMISDQHISRLSGPYLLHQVAKLVNAADADIFLTLGDIVDSNLPADSEEAAILRGIKTKHGSYGVYGNHEYYNDLTSCRNFYKEAGITLLHGASRNIRGINFVGMDDPMGKKRGVQVANPYSLLEKSFGSGNYTILLSHNPKNARRSIGLFDLQLSGHVHGGQIWPASMYYQYYSMRFTPHLSIRKDKKRNTSGHIFITNGSGFWGPPMRFLCPPEVAIIDLVPAKI